MSKYTDPMPARENECEKCGQVRAPLSAGLPHYCEPKRKVDPPLTEAEAREFWSERAANREENNKMTMICDHCADPLPEERAIAYAKLPFDIDSACEGESGVICETCDYDLVERGY